MEFQGLRCPIVEFFNENKLTDEKQHRKPQPTRSIE